MSRLTRADAVLAAKSVVYGGAACLPKVAAAMANCPAHPMLALRKCVVEDHLVVVHDGDTLTTWKFSPVVKMNCTHAQYLDLMLRASKEKDWV